MKKILLMGITGINNFGEELIADCTEYIVNHNDKKCEYDISIESFEPKMSFLKKILYYLFIGISKFDKKSTISAYCVKIAAFLRCFNVYSSKIKDCDALIFACGSIKYGTQKLWAYYSLAVDIANKYDKPIMFSGSNIQKFDANDYRCMYLRKHMVSENVIKISTRDFWGGVEKLRNDYRIPERIECERVGDSAFFIPECYGVKKNPKEKVGINVIVGSIISLYGGDISYNQLLDIYITLIQELERNGIAWELFSNGLPLDTLFGKKVLIGLKKSEKEIRIPKNQMELLDIISGYKVILGARLHACISAYSMDIPFAGFFWDDKIVDFSRATGTEQLFFTAADLDGIRMAQKLAYLYSNGYEFDQDRKKQLKSATQDAIDEFLLGLSKEKSFEN
ncbi:polysaccharide pyruvyl transferase family protein [Butyrivibrio sp. YAB3001]|uniref:polysaccharide pyruvyl transferase family protein n=1 Tax=Butyrivibrio sp. YAB3001 TaxID=1520812 RepID=UPI0008F6681B|nr:polysaccharide pyruvyl transferase family protein [Butyrivibrio sp. YAB3001]SFC26708.1 Polysaccharide pyruvyl transferase family protein WcaK [Butyrivibrio sp. YAB3001]